MRPAIVLLHGFTHTGASWRALIDELGERYRALAPDIRGHGSAGARRPIDFASCVDDVLALESGSFTLVGYSMGARLALHVALAAPDRVQRLVLVSPTAGIADVVERGARAEEDAELATELESGLDIETFARRWAAQPMFRRQPSPVADAAHEDRLRNDPANLAAALRGLGAGSMEPEWGRLRELHMPVALIVGERDAKYRKLAERMATLIADAQLLVVPAVGHAVHLEAPVLLATAIHERASARQDSC